MRGLELSLSPKRRAGPTGPDVTPPTAVIFSPLDNATGVAISVTPTVTFNETIVFGAAGNITLKRTSDNATIQTWNVITNVGSTAGKVEIVGGSVLTLHLTSNLVNSIEYYIIWDAGIVKDLANNTNVANASTTLWSFTTVAAAGGYQAESLAIFASFTTPPTTDRKDRIDAYVVAAKAGGWWTKYDVKHEYMAADAQAALRNWKNPGTYDGIAVNSPTFTADVGFTGAATKYIDTQFNPFTAPSPKYVQDSAAVFAWTLANLSVVGALIGQASLIAAVNGAIIYPRHPTGAAFYARVNNTATNITAGSTDSTGLWCASRNSSTATDIYCNGVAVFLNGTGVSAAPANANICFLTAGSEAWTGNIASSGILSQLSAAEQLSLYQAELAYQAGIATDKIVAAFTTPPTAGRKTLIYNYVYAMMDAGVWNKDDINYKHAAADVQAALINWKTPGTYSATAVNSPTFTVDLGFTSDGLTSYLDTGFNPQVNGINFVLNSACAWGWSLVSAVVNGGLIGNTAGSINVLPRNTGDIYNLRVNNTSGSIGGASLDGSGLTAVSRSTSTLTEGFKNGALIGSQATASLTVSNLNAQILKSGGAPIYYTGPVASVGLSGHLNATEQLARYNAERAYATGVGIP